jgi:hypothetical protein
MARSGKEQTSQAFSACHPPARQPKELASSGVFLGKKRTFGRFGLVLARGGVIAVGWRLAPDL